MRVAVAGGTGLTGRHVVQALRAAGHEPVVLARSAGVDLVTGAGLDAALAETAVTIDVSNVLTLRRAEAVAFFDLAGRSGMSGIQEWLSFYFKSPQVGPGLYPEHDLFIQLTKLKNTLRHLRGEELITHLGLEYYD